MEYRRGPTPRRTELQELRAKLQGQADEAAAAKAKTDAAPADEPHTREDGYNEVSPEALKTIFFGDLSADLTDEFRLTAADASLDPETVGQLRAAATPPPPEPPPPPPTLVAEPAAPPLPRPQVASPPARAAEPAPLLAVVQKRFKPGRLLLWLIVAVILATVGYWLLGGAELGWLR